ncbi:MAG: hypothetical protein HWN70_08755, partial [Desulfobacterales bacterium]|nr:hypothetical protein [Desulfobacterales bacterium]
TLFNRVNPLRAGVVKSLKELKGYKGCGHSAIMGRVKREWQDTDTVLAYFGKNRRTATERYESFVEQGISHGRRPELGGGGLVRSCGGWSQVLSLRRVGSKVFSDERILGSSEFVKDVIADAEQKAKETLRLSLKISDLPSLAMEVCEGEGVDEPELRSGLRKREVVKSRRVFCQIAVKKWGILVRMSHAFLVSILLLLIG